jgi:hypothetical protein
MFRNSGFHLIRTLKNVIRRHVREMPSPGAGIVVCPFGGKPANAEFYPIKPQITEKLAGLLQIKVW